MAFVFAAFVWILGSVFAVFYLFAVGMSNNPETSARRDLNFWRIVFGSIFIAFVIASSHWWPRLSW